MTYPVKPRKRTSVKGWWCLSFAKYIDAYVIKVCKNMSNKDSQTLLDSVKKSTTYAIKIASKRAIQKTAEATGDLIGIKLDEKITSILQSSQNPPKKLHLKQMIME